MLSVLYCDVNNCLSVSFHLQEILFRHSAGLYYTYLPLHSSSTNSFMQKCILINTFGSVRSSWSAIVCRFVHETKTINHKLSGSDLQAVLSASFKLTQMSKLYPSPVAISALRAYLIRQRRSLKHLVLLLQQTNQLISWPAQCQVLSPLI